MQEADIEAYYQVCEVEEPKLKKDLWPGHVGAFRQVPVL
jgi:hypothetical protein